MSNQTCAISNSAILGAVTQTFIQVAAQHQVPVPVGQCPITLEDFCDSAGNPICRIVCVLHENESLGTTDAHVYLNGRPIDDSARHIFNSVALQQARNLDSRCPICRQEIKSVQDMPVNAIEIADVVSLMSAQRFAQSRNLAHMAVRNSRGQSNPELFIDILRHAPDAALLLSQKDDSGCTPIDLMTPEFVARLKQEAISDRAVEGFVYYPLNDDLKKTNTALLSMGQHFSVIRPGDRIFAMNRNNYFVDSLDSFHSIQRYLCERINAVKIILAICPADFVLLWDLNCKKLYCQKIKDCTNRTYINYPYRADISKIESADTVIPVLRIEDSKTATPQAWHIDTAEASKSGYWIGGEKYDGCYIKGLPAGAALIRCDMQNYPYVYSLHAVSDDVIVNVSGQAHIIARSQSILLSGDALRKGDVTIGFSNRKILAIGQVYFARRYNPIEDVPAGVPISFERAIELRNRFVLYRLRYAVGGQYVDRIVFITNSTTLGRLSCNDISLLPDGGWSRRHARIELDSDGNLQIIDLGSLLGTFVDHRMIASPSLLSRETTHTMEMGAVVMQISEISPVITPDNLEVLPQLLMQMGRRSEAQTAARILGSENLTRLQSYTQTFGAVSQAFL